MWCAIRDLDKKHDCEVYCLPITGSYTAQLLLTSSLRRCGLSVSVGLAVNVSSRKRMASDEGLCVSCFSSRSKKKQQQQSFLGAPANAHSKQQDRGRVINIVFPLRVNWFCNSLVVLRGLSSRRRGRREEREMGKGYPPPKPTRGSGERRKLPYRA